MSGWGAAPLRPQRPSLLVLTGQGPPSPSPFLLSPCWPLGPALPLGPQPRTGRQLRRLLVAAIDEDELRYQFVKKKGYVRLHTNLGDLNLELHCDLVRGCPPPGARAAAGWPGSPGPPAEARPRAPGAPRTVEAAAWLTGAFGLLQTPKTCENFIRLCKKQYYDGTVFHRSIRNFVVSADAGCPPPGCGVLPVGVLSPWSPGALGPSPAVHIELVGEIPLSLAEAGGSWQGSSLACSSHRSREATQRALAQVGAGAGPLGCQLRLRPRATACTSSPVSSLRLCGEASGPQGPPSGRRPRVPATGVELCPGGCSSKAPQPAGRLGQPTLPRVEFTLRAWGWGSRAAGGGGPWAAGAGSP